MEDNKKSMSLGYKTITKKEKYCFGIGALGKDANCNMISSFYMLFLTDVLFIAPAFIGILFFLARIWDAVNDLVMGLVIDNTRSKYGKFRIWILVGTLINSIILVLMFSSFRLQGTALYVYVTITYILYGMTYTIMDIPYWSWLPNLTNDPGLREKISVVPRIFASLASFLVGTFGLYAIKWFNKCVGNQNSMAESGFTIFAVFIVVVFITTICITVFNVKEESTIRSNKAKTNMKQALKIMLKNDQLIAFIGLLLAFNLCTQFVRGFAIYYFKSVCGNPYLYSVFGMTFVAEMAGLFCFPYISNKIGREKVFKMACVLPIIGLILMALAGIFIPQNPIAIIISSCIFMFGSGSSLGVTTCCIADVIDYGEVKFGIRNESIICSTQTFLMKLAMALSGLLTGVGLQVIGYDAKATVQSNGTIMGLRILMLLIPIALVVISYIIYKKYYTLKDKKLETVLLQVNKMHLAEKELDL